MPYPKNSMLVYTRDSTNGSMVYTKLERHPLSQNISTNEGPKNSTEYKKHDLPRKYSTAKETAANIIIYTVCQRSLYKIYVLIYHKKRAKTSWTDSRT